MKRFEELLAFIGKNKNKEYLKIIIINIVCIALLVTLTILLKQIMAVFIGIIVILVVNYLIFDSYLARKKEILNERENEFITMISYIQFFLSNSYNIYQSFQAVSAYASPWMEEQLQSLILEIDHDKSVKPFLNFANKFQTHSTNNIMLSLYQMVDEGENSLHMMQFNNLFLQLSRNQQKQLIDNKDRSMSSLSSLPLIGAGAITILLTFGIISIMGEMVNVL